MSPKFQESAVADKFQTYPPQARKQLLKLRQLIFKVAEQTPGVDPLTETLKWGEPSYLTRASNSGTTVRIDWKAKQPEYYGLYVNCKTTLISDFRALYADLFNYVGNRAILFEVDGQIPLTALSHCIELALTYKKK